MNKRYFLSIVFLAVLIFLVISMPLLAQRGNLPPTRLHKSLKFVPADSVVLYDFYWSAFVDSARSRYPNAKLRGRGTEPHKIRIPKMSEKRWHAELEAWEKFVKDSLNLLGGVGDVETTNQTLAAINTIHRTAPLYLATGDARYFEAIDYALQNGVRGGLSLYDTEMERFAAATEAANAKGYFAATSDSALYLNLFAACEITARVGARDVFVDMTASYPWTGIIKAKIDVRSPNKRLKVYVRLPLWTNGKTLFPERYVADRAYYHRMISVSDAQENMKKEKQGYLCVEREWGENDMLVIEFSMPNYIIRSTDKPDEMAIKRGPLVYGFISPTDSLYYDAKSYTRNLFDNKVRQAFIINGLLQKTPPPYSEGRKPEVPFRMAPYYVLHEEGRTRVAIFAQSQYSDNTK